MSHIVIFEDDEDIANLMGILLTSMNCTYEIYESFIETMTELELKQPDMVIVDYWLPNGTAEKFIPKLRDHTTLSTLPILLISAVNNLSTIAQSLNVSYIPKPFDIDHFQKVIKEMLAIT